MSERLMRSSETPSTFRERFNDDKAKAACENERSADKNG